jgi:hypothetical protein
MRVPPPSVSDKPSPAWFCGDGAVTGVGSLPFVEPARAIEFVVRHAPEVPFWPQLRRMSPREAMVPQLLGGAFKHVTPVRGEYAYQIPRDRIDRFVAALSRDDARLEPANAAGFYAFVEAAGRGTFPQARAAKGQIMGPVTTLCGLESDGTPLVELADVRGPLADHVVRIASWQAETLLRVFSSVVMVLDEAYLGVALRTRPAVGAAMVELLRSAVLRIRRPGVLVGLHCCDQLPFAAVHEISPDVLSFDAHHGSEAFAADAHARRFLAEGGHVAWGWVPTRDDLSGVDADVVAARWWGAAHRMSQGDEGIDVERIRCRSLVTASCGLAGYSDATCERSFELARDITRRFRDLAEQESNTT